MVDRTPAYPINPVFTERWSPRAFTDETISEETLLAFLEAAHWAPSAYNIQPWRFIYARRGTPAWPKLLGILNEFNQGWAKSASALVLFISRTTWLPPKADSAQPVPSHSFDTGAAWGYFALQASMAGWAAHGMTGFDHDAAYKTLGIPADWAVEAVAAVGRRNPDASGLPEGLRSREAPSPRSSIRELSAEGEFKF